MPLNDHKSRQIALNYNESYIIQAPAGSGKTELLTQRFLNLLANAVSNPEEILAITFTKKAAIEMHERIYQAIIHAHKNGSPPKDEHKKTTWLLARKVLQNDEQRQWNILSNPKRLCVSTIDSFCQRIIKFMPILSEMTQNPEITEDSYILYNDCVSRLLKDVKHSPSWGMKLKVLLSNLLDNDIEQLTNLLSEMLSKREQWMPIIFNTDISNTKDKLEKNFNEFISKQLEILYELMPKNQLQLWEQLISFSETNIKSKTTELKLSNSSKSLLEWQKVINLAFTKSEPPKLRKRIDKSIGFPAQNSGESPDEKKIYGEMKKKLKNAISILQENPVLSEKLLFIYGLHHLNYTKEDWTSLESICEVLKVACQYLQLVFAEKNKVDFTQIQLSAITALGNDDTPTDISLYLDHKLRHILIDEFQDTSATQFKLLRQLTNEWIPKDGNTFFLVGDPMQSIYRFRQAEVQRFLEVKKYGIGNIKPKAITLSSNFRSSKTIIDWINNTFNYIFPRVENQHLGAIKYSPSISIQKYENSYVEHYLSDSEISESIWIINKVKQLLATKEQSIAILGKTRAHLTHIINELNLNNINFTENQIQNLGNLDVIKDLKSLTFSMIDIMDKLSWVEMLHSPIFGITLEEISKIIEEDPNASIYHNLKKLISNQSINRNKINIIINFYDNIFLNSRPRSLHKIIYHIWCSVDGPAIHTNTKSHLQSFLSTLEKNEQQGILKEKAQFINELSQLKAEANNDYNVQVMTLHKSKGLEFDTVFLPGLNRKKINDKSTILRYDSFINKNSQHQILLAPKPYNVKSKTLYHLLKKTNEKRLLLEEQRLLYVAATRAKKRLILTATLNKESPEKSSLLNHLWIPTKDKWVHIERNDSTIKPDNQRQVQPLIKKYTLKNDINSNHTPLLKQQLPDNNIPIPYNIKSYIDRKIGIIIHFIFENLADSNVPVSQLKPIAYKFIASLNLKGIAQHNLFKIVKKILDNISTDQTATWLFKKRKISYKELTTHRISQKGKLIEEILDYTFVENETCWVIDFKVSSPNKNECLTDFLTKEKDLYYDQLKNYQYIMRNKLKLTTKTALYFPLIPYLYEIDIDS